MAPGTALSKHSNDEVPEQCREQSGGGSLGFALSRPEGPIQSETCKAVDEGPDGNGRCDCLIRAWVRRAHAPHCSHAVGPEGANLPIFGWNGLGGDLRIAHFLGIHAERAIPLIIVVAADARAATRWALLIGGTAAYVVATVAVFAQAVAGRPLPAL